MRAPGAGAGRTDGVGALGGGTPQRWSSGSGRQGGGTQHGRAGPAPHTAPTLTRVQRSRAPSVRRLHRAPCVDALGGKIKGSPRSAAARLRRLAPAAALVAGQDRGELLAPVQGGEDTHDDAGGAREAVLVLAAGEARGGGGELGAGRGAAGSRGGGRGGGGACAQPSSSSSASSSSASSTSADCVATSDGATSAAPPPRLRVKLGRMAAAPGSSKSCTKERTSTR